MVVVPYHVYHSVKGYNIIKKEKEIYNTGHLMRVFRGAQGPPPPLEFEKQKQKKRSSQQILSYFTYILLPF